MLTGTLDTDVAGGTDWVQVLTGTLPGSGAGWATGGTGADGARLPEFNGGLGTQLHAGVSHCSRFPRVSDWCTQLHAEASPRRGHGGPEASLGVRSRGTVAGASARGTPRSQASELLIPPCLIRCH